MSEAIRVLTKEGTERFRDFVLSIPSNPTSEPPFSILDDPEFAIEIPKSAKISRGGLTTKMELAERIDSALAAVDIEEFDRDRLEGLWNWLSLYFFDLITNNRKTFGEVHRFLVSQRWDRRSRHLIESTYNAYKNHGEYASVILENNPWTGGEVFNNLAGTQEYWMNRSLFRTVHSLYWDSVNKKPKTGITPREKPGTIRRLISLLNQLSRTYDLFSITHDEFQTLMPPEFDRWIDVNHESN